MKTVKNSLIISAFLATSAAAFAMPPGGPACDEAAYASEHKDGHMAKHQAERLKQLHAALKLRPEQESAWQKFQVALEPPAERPQKMAAAADTPSRLEQMREHHQQAGKHLEAHIEAVKTFYAALTPEQKKIFDEFHSPARGRRNAR